jgi:hypothetical protein
MKVWDDTLMPDSSEMNERTKETKAVKIGEYSRGLSSCAATDVAPGSITMIYTDTVSRCILLKMHNQLSARYVWACSLMHI